MDEVTQTYRTKATELADVLGTVVSPEDPGRGVVEPWAETVSGRILDLGAGTGRWTGHLAALGHDVEGLEPVDRFVELARRTHPAVPFRHASLADLMGTDERWSGILAWYSLIHLRPDELPTALSALRSVLEDGGSLLVSFFSGPSPRGVPAPSRDGLPMADDGNGPNARGCSVRGHRPAVAPPASSRDRHREGLLVLVKDNPTPLDHDTSLTFATSASNNRD